MANETKLTPELRSTFANKLFEDLRDYYNGELFDWSVNPDDYQELTGMDFYAELRSFTDSRADKYIDIAISEIGGEAKLAEYIQNGFVSDSYDMSDMTENTEFVAIDDFANVGPTPWEMAQELNAHHLGCGQTEFTEAVYNEVKDHLLFGDVRTDNLLGKIGSFYISKLQGQVEGDYFYIGVDARTNGTDSKYYLAHTAQATAQVWYGLHESMIADEWRDYLAEHEGWD